MIEQCFSGPHKPGIISACAVVALFFGQALDITVKGKQKVNPLILTGKERVRNIACTGPGLSKLLTKPWAKYKEVAIKQGHRQRKL